MKKFDYSSDLFFIFFLFIGRYSNHLKETGFHELEAQEKLNSFKPSMIQKLLKTAEKEEEKLRQEVSLAREKDSEESKELIRTTRLANRILQQDTDAYLQVIEELSPLDDLLEFGSGFEFITEDPKTLEVEFNVHSKNVVPTEQKTLTKTGKTDILPVLSVRFDKATLSSLNFEAIDCSDSMVNFQHNMKFRKTQGFAPVEKVQLPQ
ncbi:hypothetical protein [Planococcus sp. ISL-110]|uniref:hypothetical protein n=1 Tax=Planococcus sp. ISL-110 TaxID=2819167 RepID=UPI001BEC4E7B|nr:hypothetical protein [Planococcus sp. ISL-110]MBT2569734.1 hypothetical protein [Planococcus sp. ISL-110]